ncbi:response regulator [Dyadobacter psychrophilus]|uniref:Two component transcriptional regulator, LytTR family n=1 Tax=Dyadobacter psychrophilus TaxID=651661 RepID=A0A1T5DYL7_9BACT|nr:response regulator [Dyadobacter psychrophilus]SKB76922.1 two component transcriptional regulator, LytTR family [Dyadobacter psychrophilus]
MQQLNVLIVEDDVLTATDIRKTLEKAGHQITAVARSFREAVSAVDRQIPDIVLLDIVLSGSLDGVAVGKEILLREQIPIVVLTGSTEEETYQRVKETFIPSGYLTKPFRPLDLRRSVDLAWQNFRPQLSSAGSAALSEDSVFLPVEKGFEKIVKSEVTYISTQKGMHSVHIFEIYKKQPRLVQLSMGHLEQYFSLPNFYRLSRSLLINLNYIERIESGQIKIQDERTLLTIPEAGRPELMKRLAVVRGPKKS